MYNKLTHCKYCQISLDGYSTSHRANHSRWCVKNPKRSEYAEKNNGQQLNTPLAKEKRRASIAAAHARGSYKDSQMRRSGKPGKPTSPETIELLRKKALESTHRRLVRSIRDYTKVDGSIVKLDSAWEEALAKRLDSIGIEWIRPAAVKWVDKDGVTRNYFPDFYLPKFDLYLDPKNPYALKAQQDKVNCLAEQFTNLRMLLSLGECLTFDPR